MAKELAKILFFHVNPGASIWHSSREAENDLCRAVADANAAWMHLPPPSNGPRQAASSGPMTVRSLGTLKRTGIAIRCLGRIGIACLRRVILRRIYLIGGRRKGERALSF